MFWENWQRQIKWALCSWTITWYKNRKLENKWQLRHGNQRKFKFNGCAKGTKSVFTWRHEGPSWQPCYLRSPVSHPFLPSTKMAAGHVTSSHSWHYELYKPTCSRIHPPTKNPRARFSPRGGYCYSIMYIPINMLYLRKKSALFP